MKKRTIKAVMLIVLIMALGTMTLSAMDSGDLGVSPCYNHTQVASLTISFDSNDTVYCDLSIMTYGTGTGTSGLMRLYDSTGACLKEWAVSDYVQPIGVENTYPGTYGERYIVTYEGYVYGNNMTAPDWISLQATDSNVYN